MALDNPPFIHITVLVPCLPSACYVTATLSRVPRRRCARDHRQGYTHRHYFRETKLSKHDLIKKIKGNNSTRIIKMSSRNTVTLARPRTRHGVIVGLAGECLFRHGKVGRRWQLDNCGADLNTSDLPRVLLSYGGHSRGSATPTRHLQHRRKGLEASCGLTTLGTGRNPPDHLTTRLTELQV